MITVATLLFSTPKPSSYLVSTPFATNIRYPKVIDDKTIYYFSGSAFVAYDLGSYQTTALTTNFTLPTPSSISIAKNGAIFESSDYTADDQLAAELVQKGLRIDQDYWWLIDFQSGNISLLGNNSDQNSVQGAIWQDDNTYVYAEYQVDSELFQIYRASIGQAPTKIGAISSYSRLVSATKDSLGYLDTSGAEYKYMIMNLADGTKKEALSGVGAIAASGPDNSVLAIGVKEVIEPDPSSQEGSLMLYDGSNNSSKEIFGDFTGSASWQANSGEILAVGTGPEGELLTARGKVTDLEATELRFGVNDISQYGLGLTATGVSSKGLAFTDGTGQLFLASASPINNLPGLPDQSSLQQGVYQDAFNLQYDNSTTSYVVYIKKNPYQDNITSAMDYIKSKGLDPYQLNISWRAFNNVDTGFRIPAGQLPEQLAQPQFVPEISVGAEPDY